MYPSTTVQIVDQSVSQKIKVTAVDTAPTFMVGFASDRGTEDFTYFDNSEDWQKTYGYTVNFKKYGQALAQAALIMKNNGKTYSKRVVAPDSKLANLAVYATVVPVRAHTVTETAGAGEGTDSGDGADLDDDTPTTTNPTTTTTNVPASVSITYNSVSVDCQSNDMEVLAAAVEGALPASNPSTGAVVLPLFVLAGSGRGAWAPRFRITPNYRFSRTAGFAKYLLEVISDDLSDIETIYFSFNPNKIENGKSISLDMGVETQSFKTRALIWEDSFDTLVELIQTTLGQDLSDMDLLFGKNLKGENIEGLIIDQSQFNLQNVYGNTLEKGSDGSFGDRPLETAAYTNELLKLFNGSHTDTVYNLDSVFIDFVPDANYPVSVKRAIEEFVTWRTDAFFLRDCGLEVRTVSDIQTLENSVLHNFFSSTYINSMKVLDPDSGKYVDVTIIYLLIPKLINHYINGYERPFAGIRYGVFWIHGNEIKKGSINFLPKVTNLIDEKQQLDDLGVNYVSIYSEQRVVLETLYTAQQVNTLSELSFSCNVWGVQRLVKMLREKCPASRYTIANGDDLVNYQTALSSQISQYSSKFDTLDIEYQADPTYEANKIYYAVLKVKFKGFYQAEFFKIVALPVT